MTALCPVSSVPPRWRDDTSADFCPASHVGLPRQEGLLQDLAGEIVPVAPGRVLTPPRPLSLLLPSVALAGRKVPVHVSAEQPDLVLGAEFFGADGGALGPAVPLLPVNRGNYFNQVSLAPGVWRVVVKTGSERPAGTIDDLLVVAEA